MQFIRLMFHEQITLDIYRMTICIENHFTLNKMLLLTVGLWPYHRTKLIEFHQFFLTAILISFIVVQVYQSFINHIIKYSISI